ncbi:unnamed protein product [Closterium sp. NIES-54]
MHALSVSDEGDCYRCVPPDPGIAVAALGASESVTLPETAPAQALHTFTLDSGTSACFFCDSTTLTPLSPPVPVRLADPSGGPVVARSSTVLLCLAVLSGSLSGLHLPSFSANLVSTAALQDAMLTTTTPEGQRVMICTCTQTGRHLATFTRWPGSSLYTLATEPPQVAVPAQMSASGKVAVSCSSLPPLPPSPALPCLPCVEGRQRAAPHSLFPPTTAPLQTLHMDMWGPAHVSGQSRERYFLLVVDDYTRYTTVFPLHSKGQVIDVLIPWICTVRLQLRERFGQDLPVLRLHSDRGGEFFSNLLQDFCRGEGILQSFTLPDFPQQNEIAERRIGLVMEVARTSMIHAAAPHFMWPFAVRYAAHQLNLWPRVSLSKTSPTLCWTGEVGDASVFWVWGSRAFVRDTSADKLSPCAIPCVFLGFVPNTPGWKFYHPTSRRVFPSQDVTFDESVPLYRLFPYRSAPPPPPPLFLAPGPPPVDPLPPQGPSPSGVSQVDPLLGVAPIQVAVGSGAARGAASGGVASGGAGPGGAESEGAETGGAEPGGVETGGCEPGGAEPEGVEPGGTVSDVLEDRQEDFESLAAAVPRFASMVIAREGDPDAADIPTPCYYAEAITGPYSSQWLAAMDAKMASWKSIGTYVDEVPPPGANIVDGMWIFRVKRPLGSPPAFKARYVARGFSQRQGVDYFLTFSPTLKMINLWVLLHIAAQRDYELHSLDFSTAFLQGSLHKEIWLRRPPGFTESFPAGTQWSLRRPVYDLRQVPREWHDTLRTTLAALGFSPTTSDLSLFLRTNTSLLPFYVLIYVDDLVFATADTEGTDPCEVGAAEETHLH